MKYGELNLGQIEAVVNKLGGMEGVQRLLAGHSEVVTKNSVIDCDAAPFIPYDTWKVQKHQKDGQFKFDASQIDLAFQKNGDKDGHKFRKEFARKPVLNANVLDHLLANQHLIPEHWKGKNDQKVTYVVFWGTVYRELPSNNLYVRSLCWDGARWAWRHHRLDERFGFNCLAVLRID